MLDPFIEVLLELRQTFFARKRFVVTKESEDDIGFGIGQLKAVLPHRGAGVELCRLRYGRLASEPLVRRPESHRAESQRDLVARIAQVAKDQVVLREASNQPRLEPAEILHPFGERVADEADVVAFLKLKIGGDKDVRNEQTDEGESDVFHSDQRQKSSRERWANALVSLRGRETSTGR